MANIDVVIKIPEEVYESAKNGTLNEIQSMYICGSVVEGTPLPKGHGDLVDRKALLNNGYQMEPIEMWYGIKHADTIIKADKEVNHEGCD